MPLAVHILRTRGMHATYWELFHVPTHAWIVGWSFRLLWFSGNRDIALKTDVTCVSVSSADKDSEKTIDSFNRIHMIWIDRL